MSQVNNGMSAAELGRVAWLKSSYSGSQSGNCVELAALAEGQVAMRNSRDPEGPALIYTRSEVSAFVRGAKNGEFDHLM